jgi:hypothetical protein
MIRILSISNILLVIACCVIAWYAHSYEELYDRYMTTGAELEAREREIQEVQEKLLTADNQLSKLKRLAHGGMQTQAAPNPKRSREGEERVPSREDESVLSPEEEQAATRERIVKTQVAAVGRLIELSEAEAFELEEMYRARQDEAAPFRALEDILGEERADFVRAEQRKAFSRNEMAEIERDTYYLSRKLGLSPQQEGELLNALTEVEMQIEEERKGSSSAGDMRARISRMVREAQLYRRFLLERMQKILTPEQIQQYAEIDRDSSAADVELWHAPPEPEASESAVDEQ